MKKKLGSIDQSFILFFPNIDTFKTNQSKHKLFLDQSTVQSL